MIKSVHKDSGKSYVFLKIPDHPKANGSGWVAEHIVVVEKVLGRYLPDGSVVHHVDENTLRNGNNNLVLCENAGYHQLLHFRKRALESCGNANWLKCIICKDYDDPENLYVRIQKNGKGIVARHRDCHAEYERNRLKEVQDERN